VLDPAPSSCAHSDAPGKSGYSITRNLIGIFTLPTTSISMSSFPLTMSFAPFPVSNMLNKLHGQPDSYDKKYVGGIPLFIVFY